MKVIVVVKNRAGGGAQEGSVSNATRYIAESERDEQREGKKPRRLFNADEDRLGSFRANRWLGAGAEPRVKDLLHIVISFADERDYLLLGKDEEVRQAVLRAMTRTALAQLADELKAEDLRWSAGVHRNTDNPHLHLLIRREFTDRETGNVKRLKTLPAAQRVRWENAADGTRVMQPGALQEAVEKLLEERLSQSRQRHAIGQGESGSRINNQQQDERHILGQALLAQEQVEELQIRHAQLVAMGERQRAKLADQNGRVRVLSEYELQQRARVRAAQYVENIATNSAQPLPPERREQLHENAYRQSLREYAPVAELLGKVREKHLLQVVARLEAATKDAEELTAQAQAIQARYEVIGEPVPQPYLSRDAIAKLEERAVQNEDAGKLRRWEDLRERLMEEQGKPIRTAEELARLQAWSLLAQSKLAVAEKVAADFEERKHLMPWSNEQKKLSVAMLDRKLAYEADQSKFIGVRVLHWDDRRRTEAAVNVQTLADQRSAMLLQIAEQRSEQQARIAQAKALTETLTAIFTSEQMRNQDAGQALPLPELTQAEWIALDAHAAQQNSPEAYRQLIALEAQHDARHSHDQTALRASRAQGRALVTEQQQRAAGLRWEEFQEWRATQAVIVRDDGAQELVLARLADVTPRGRMAQAFQTAFIRQEEYRVVAAAVAAQETRLQEQLQQTKETHGLLAVEAEVRAVAFAEKHPDQALPLPVFTPRELSQLELHAGREPDAQKRAEYVALYREAINDGRGLYGVERSPALSLPNEDEHTLDFFLATPAQPADDRGRRLEFARTDTSVYERDDGLSR